MNDLAPLKAALATWLAKLPDEDKPALSNTGFDDALAKTAGAMRRFMVDNKIDAHRVSERIEEIMGLMSVDGHPKAMKALWAEYARQLTGNGTEANAHEIRVKLAQLLAPIVYIVPRDGPNVVPNRTNDVDAMVQEAATKQAQLNREDGLWVTSFFHPLDQVLTDLLSAGKLAEAQALRAQYDLAFKMNVGISDGAKRYTGQLPAGETLPKDRITVSYQKVPSEGVMRDVNRAFELDKMGKHHEALEIYRSIGPQVVGLDDPEKAAIYYNRLGLCWHHLGEEKNASDACREALEQKYDFAPAKYNLATIMLALGQKDEAIGWLEMAVKAKPEFFRDLAGKDRDFNSIRTDPAFRKLIGLPALA